jgi:[ribosomal protein S5]-alanine N-acetyltransferase
MQFVTERLSILPLTKNDGPFIFELVNSDGWLKFIGNRNVRSEAEAIAYIERILGNKNISYWVVKLKENKESIGIVTFIQRDNLDHPDIGFAFLPRFSHKGYAYEATNVVLNKLIEEKSLSHILATTIPENISSIKLLEKLGLRFEKEIEVDHQKLFLYAAATETLNG